MEVKFAEMINMAKAGDEFHSLKEAKDSPDWPEWEHTIRAELQQLQEKQI